MGGMQCDQRELPGLDSRNNIFRLFRCDLAMSHVAPPDKNA